MEWVRLVELSVGTILMIGVIAKAREPDGFAEALRGYGLLPERLALNVAILLIMAEAAAGVLLLSGVWSPGGLFLAALLFLGFSGASWLQFARQSRGGAALECGCLGGALRLRHSAASAVLNSAVCLICVGAAVAAAFGTDPGSSLAGDLGPAMLILLAVVLSAMYWLSQFAISVLAEMASDQDPEEALS
jgi:hypothetical protein